MSRADSIRIGSMVRSSCRMKRGTSNQPESTGSISLVWVHRSSTTRSMWTWLNITVAMHFDRNEMWSTKNSRPSVDSTKVNNEQRCKRKQNGSTRKMPTTTTTISWSSNLGTHDRNDKQAMATNGNERVVTFIFVLIQLYGMWCTKMKALT